MARSAILGNGSLTVGLNNKGFVHDFYYPYVGQENLTTARSVRHKLGIWIDGDFSWIDDDTRWSHSVELSSDALIATSTWTYSETAIRLVSSDFVDSQDNVWCRRLTIFNESTEQHEVRVFFHQVFQLSQNGRADTAAYIPAGNYILNYKGRFNLLISGRDQNGDSFDQYAVGNYGIEGKTGTYMDAEDGELSNNNVEHAGVDSVIRFSQTLQPGQIHSIDYWIIACDSAFEGNKLHEDLSQKGLDSNINSSLLWWSNWLSVSNDRLQNLPADRQGRVRKSLMTIRAHCDKNGGVIASCDSSIYNYGRDYYSYVWPRDGSYVLWPLIRLGYTEEAKNFFNFCASVASSEGYLMHKYQPDGYIGSSWHPRIQSHVDELPIQEDETAALIVLLNEFSQVADDREFVERIYNNFVIKAANFLATYTDEQTGLPHPSYDLWEEKFLTSTYSTALTYRALQAASEIAIYLGVEPNSLWQEQAKIFLQNADAFKNPENATYRKGFKLDDQGLVFDDTADASSIYGILSYGFYKPEEAPFIHKAMQNTLSTLRVPVSPHAFARHDNDGYFKADQNQPGNPWVIVTLWVAQYYIRAGHTTKANEMLSWIESTAFKGDMLPEQLDPKSGLPISVTPLVWSHAEYISTILDLEQRQ